MNKDVLPSKRPAPFGVRLTPEERAELDRRAKDARLSLGGYIKSVIFNTPPPRRSHRPPPNAEELSRILRALGSVGANTNRCALLANMGSWPSEERLNAACDDIQWMRHTLMVALGMTPADQPKDQPEP